MLLYFNVCNIFAIPIVLTKIQKLKFRMFVMVYVGLVAFRLCFNAITNPDKTSMSYGFREFNTIFEAPSIQIDQVKTEHDKYLPYRNML